MATTSTQSPAAEAGPHQGLIDGMNELKEIIKDLRESMKEKDRSIKELKDQLMQQGTGAGARTTLSPTDSEYCESDAQAAYTKGMPDPQRDTGKGVACLIESDSDQDEGAHEVETRNTQQQQRQRQRQPRQPARVPEVEKRKTQQQQQQRQRQPEQPPQQQQHTDRTQKRKLPEMPEQRRRDRADGEDVFRTSDPWSKKPQGSGGEESERPNRYRPKGQDERQYEAPEDEEVGWQAVGKRGRVRVEGRSERDQYRRDDSESSDRGHDQFSDERSARRQDSRDRGRSRRPRALNYRRLKTPDTYSGSHATYKE